MDEMVGNHFSACIPVWLFLIPEKTEIFARNEDIYVMIR